MIGTILGDRYEILEKIGSGGMAVVYKARCNLLNRNVAIKILRDDFKDDEDFIKRFGIESQAAAGLSHQNIVSIYDVGRQGDIHYIVMEYVEGITLKKYQSEKPRLSIKRAMDFTIQIASALQHAHRKGIIHRDIKPQNILVTKDNVLKVTDFGIARAVTAYTQNVEKSSMGSAHYCSPEQARGGYTDEKSDIYSLGIVMYEMLTGKLPFDGQSSVSVAVKHIQEEAILPSQINPDIPTAVETVVIKAMQKDQSQRYTNINEILIDLNWVYHNISDQSKEAEEKADSTTRRLDVTGVETLKTGDDTMKKSKTKTKKPKTKEDRIAVISAIVVSILIVSAMTFGVLKIVFPTMFSGRGEMGELETPDLVGLTIDEAKRNYSRFEIKETSRDFSNEYSEGVIILQDPSENTMLKSPFEIKVAVSKGSKTVDLPNLVNFDYRKAGIELDKLEVLWVTEFETSDSIPENVVISQMPEARTKVTAGLDTVTLKVSSGRDSKLIKVPDVIGKTEEEAKRLITKAGLTVIVVPETSEKMAGTVIRQSATKDSEVEEKAAITITVSSGAVTPTPTKSPQPHVTNGPSEGQTIQVTLDLPNDREKVTVRVTANANTIYNKTHNTSERHISIPVTGSGSVKIVVYYDGTIVQDKTVNL